MNVPGVEKTSVVWAFRELIPETIKMIRAIFSVLIMKVYS
jgi:hypothetical protein